MNLTETCDFMILHSQSKICLVTFLDCTFFDLGFIPYLANEWLLSHLIFASKCDGDLGTRKDRE